MIAIWISWTHIGSRKLKKCAYCDLPYWTHDVWFFNLTSNSLQCDKLSFNRNPARIWSPVTNCKCKIIASRLIQNCVEKLQTPVIVMIFINTLQVVAIPSNLILQRKAGKQSNSHNLKCVSKVNSRIIFFWNTTLKSVSSPAVCDLKKSGCMKTTVSDLVGAYLWFLHTFFRKRRSKAYIHRRTLRQGAKQNNELL